MSDYCAHWCVSPEGSPSGKGTRERPWDIATALAHPAQVGPGDVIWVRGGLYRPQRTLLSTLEGAAGRPVVIRVEPGARAVFDFVDSVDRVCLYVAGSYTWFWGLEITNSTLDRWSDVAGSAGDPRGTGVLSESGPGVKYIHLSIHDVGSSLFESQNSGLEIYGCLLFNSYWVAPDRSHGPGMYVRNQPAWTRKRIENNIVFHHGRQGLQGFGSVPFSNFDVVKNIEFNNGIGPDGFHRNLMFGNASDQHLDNVFDGNRTYFPAGSGSQQYNMFGGDGGSHGLILRDNVLAAEGRVATAINKASGETVEGNLFVGRTEFTSLDGEVDVTGADFRSRFPANEFYGDGMSNPAGTWVYVTVDKYLPDAWEHRSTAHVAVYNWQSAPVVTVDLSEVASAGKIALGTTVTVRPAINFAEHVERVFQGSTIEVPMTGWTVAAPYGRDLTQEPLASTFPQFGAFVLDWAVDGPPPPESGPHLLADPGIGLPASEARAAREAAWHTSDPAQRDELRLQRLCAWRSRMLSEAQ